MDGANTRIRLALVPISVFRNNNSPDMECIYLFITYFNIELKRTKLTSHTDTKLMDMSDRLRDEYSNDRMPSIEN
jgi:hypothetical protein